MGRLIRQPRRPDIGAVRSASGRDLPPYDVVEQDSYLQRMAKYVPAEVLALSVLANGLIGQAVRDGGAEARMGGIPVATIAVVTLAAMTVLSAAWVWRIREPSDAWRLNAAMSALAFPVWSYALGAPAFDGYWDGYLAALLLAGFSVTSGFVRPPAPERLRLPATKTEYRLSAGSFGAPAQRAASG